MRITFARHPEGIVEFNKRRSLEAVQRFLTRGRPPSGGEGEAAVATQPASAPVATARVGNPGSGVVSLLESNKCL